ncbi:MAG: hypothetical protein HYV96_17020 [Opitutae bacterium]|nr:hypothetical protein [Opitutae bacterium]
MVPRSEISACRPAVRPRSGFPRAPEIPVATEPRLSIWPSITLCATVWLAAELLLLLFRPGYPFTMRGALDSWIYAGFQWDIRGQMREFGQTYYASRVALFLPGAILHAMLPVTAATVAYKLLFSAGTTAAWAFVARRIVGWRAALFASGVGPLIPVFIFTRHNDYMDLGVVLYGSLALACVVGVWRSPRPRLWRMALGASGAAMIDSNLSSALIVGPGIGVVYFLLVPERLTGRVVALTDCIAGAALTLGLLSAASAWAGGPPWVLGTQIKALFWIGGLNQNPWAPNGWAWLLAAVWLLLPFAALAWGAVVVHTLPAPDRLASPLRALTVGHAVSLGLATLLEWRGMGVLFHWFYAVFQLPLTIPVLIVCATTRSPARIDATVFAGLAVLAAPIASINLSPQFGHLCRLLHWPGSPNNFSLVLGLVTLLAILVTAPRRRAGHEGEALAIALVLCTVPWGFHTTEPQHRLADRQVLAHDAFQFLNTHFAPDSYRLWLDAAQPDGRALSSTKLYGYRLLTARPFPERGPDETTGRTVIVPTLLGGGERILAIVRQRWPRANAHGARILSLHGPSGLGFDFVCFSLVEPVPDPEAPDAMPATRLIHLRHRRGDSYASHLQQSIYGSSSNTLEFAAAAPQFTRTTSGDHLATDFIALPPCAGPAAPRELTLVIVTDHSAEAFCVVQTDGYRDAVRVPLNFAGRKFFPVKLPAESRSLRVYFGSEVDAPVALPIEVNVYETTPPAV